MTAVSQLIARLRTNGVSLRPDGTRLIVDAPRGAITPDLHQQMMLVKPEILSALAAEAPGPREDSVATKAISEIGILLATSYLRSVNVTQIGRAQGRDSGDPRLA